MVTGRKAGSGIDKGKAFARTVSGPMHHSKGGAGAASPLTQQQKGEMAVLAMKTASERTGAFKSHYAKK